MVQFSLLCFNYCIFLKNDNNEKKKKKQGMKGVRDQEQVTLILEAELGNTYFLDGNWEQGAVLFDRFVTNTTNRAVQMLLYVEVRVLLVDDGYPQQGAKG